jgi:hypothetical protein
MNLETLAELHAQWQRSARDYSSIDRSAKRVARLADHTFHEARAEAIAEFAASRGWKQGKRQFTLPMLASGRPGRSTTDDYCWSPDLNLKTTLAWDHPNFFRETHRPYRPAGVVVHVYARAPDQCQYANELAAIYGLNFEALPWSWYYPGGCLAGVYTRKADLA